MLEMLGCIIVLLPMLIYHSNPHQYEICQGSGTYTFPRTRLPKKNLRTSRAAEPTSELVVRHEWYHGTHVKAYTSAVEEVGARTTLHIYVKEVPVVSTVTISVLVVQRSVCVPHE